MAYVRFSLPDLELMKAFVEDFGLHTVHYVPSDGSTGCIYSRGLDENYPFVHVVHEGPAKFIGFGVRVRAEADLYILAQSVPGCSPVEQISGVEGTLGGGKRVSFVDPVCGFLIEAVHGQHTDPIPSRRPRPLYNHGARSEYNRLGRLQDVGNRNSGGGATGVPEMRRLGHVVVSVEPAKVVPMLIFMHDTFGLVGSDTNMGPKDKIQSHSYTWTAARNIQITTASSFFQDVRQKVMRR